MGVSSSTFPKSIVAFAAHPDDTELFTAGTLALLSAQGWAVTICSLTSGGMGSVEHNEKQTIQIRMKEANRAAQIIGADFICLGGKDAYLYDTEKLRIKALALIRRKNAGVVIGHLFNDYHPDHRAAATIVDAAAMMATLPSCPVKEKPLLRTPVFYHSSTLGATDPLGQPLPLPHFLINVSSVQQKKVAMLACHESQKKLMKVMHRIDDFMAAMQDWDTKWGVLAGCTLAEAFWQHRGGGFPNDELLQNELSAWVKFPKEVAQ